MVDDEVSDVSDELIASIEALLPDFLPRQRWYGSDTAPEVVKVVSQRTLSHEPLLLWLLVDTTGRAGDVEGVSDTPDASGDQATERYQLVVAGRPVGSEEKFLTGKERVTLGAVDGLVLYDALVDPELTLDVLTQVAPDEQAEMARPLLMEQSNTSVVFDERLILKLFRRVHTGVRNPDIEVNRTLAERGFPHVVPQLAELRRDDTDLAVVRDYLLGATDAWHLAHTSLRDLLASGLHPGDAGGDFAPDAYALGEVTATLHVALADAFGRHAARPAEWLQDMQAQVGRTHLNGIEREQVASVLDERFSLVGAEGAGKAIQTHGDLHLGQFLRGDTGWFVLDFEGEPDRPLAERDRPWSPLRDVAGVLRSFHYASRTVLVERGRDVDTQTADLAVAWEQRAVAAYWEGYLSVLDVVALLPAEPEARDALLHAFELDKAVYEIGYERAHRPSWAEIPVAAVERLLG